MAVLDIGLLKLIKLHKLRILIYQLVWQSITYKFLLYRLLILATASLHYWTILLELGHYYYYEHNDIHKLYFI